MYERKAPRPCDHGAGLVGTEGVEPTLEQILSLPPLPIGLRSRIGTLGPICTDTERGLKPLPLLVGLQERIMVPPPGIKPRIDAYKATGISFTYRGSEFVYSVVLRRTRAFVA